jgi:hypothetical protein
LNGADHGTAKTLSHSSTKRQPLTPGEPIKIAVELWLEVVDANDKFNPAFAYISQDHNPQKIVVVLNRSHWPTAGALSRNDAAALRWLTSLAILDRCTTWRGHPILAATQRYLVEAALGRWMDFQAVAWATYRLKDLPLLAAVPDLAATANRSSQPQKFAQFEVTVDSMKLDFWRQKMAQRFKRRPLAGAEENASEAAHKTPGKSFAPA